MSVIAWPATSRSWARLGAMVLLSGFAVALVVLAFGTTGFATVDNLKAIATSAALVGILASGMTYIVISGNLFSLSLGTTAAVCAIIFIPLLSAGLLVALVGAMLAGAAICALQGFAVGRWGGNPIIVTIGAGALQQGIATWQTNGQSVLPGRGAAGFGLLINPIGGIPVVVFIFALTVLVAETTLRTTRFGREIYLLGDNRRAAHAAGMRVATLATGAFAAAGICAGVCGALLGAQNGHGELMLEGTLTFDALAATLVGGNAVTGGRGAVWRTALGALVIASITDLLLLRGYSTGVQLTVKGLVVAVVAVFVQLSQRGRR